MDKLPGLEIMFLIGDASKCRGQALHCPEVFVCPYKEKELPRQWIALQKNQKLKYYSGWYYMQIVLHDLEHKKIYASDTDLALCVNHNASSKAETHHLDLRLRMQLQKPVAANSRCRVVPPAICCLVPHPLNAIFRNATLTIAEQR
ncbi:hypothetical protein DM860_012315 [Cuscuta australis]|uniref:Uncharacterized protein n=1 Tax=Cuscuta australis TaxID=267555 RepID=A0A328DR11_9ASTE|nr:hypothetical protein DM860_012315 [Cuscuta australis]